MIFTNKHVVIAMLVAPILAIMAWYAVDEFIGEKPRAAAEGQSYPLIEMSNCRYASGRCGLENEDFKLEITLAPTAAGAQLQLASAHALDGVMISIAAADHQAAPEPMQADNSTGRHWSLALNQMPDPRQRIRLVAGRGGSSWFGEATTTFIQGKADGNGLTR